MDIFYTHVMKESETISGIVRNDVDMMPLTPEEERQFRESTVCGNCAKSFTDRNRKVRHHCHISGQYQFAACNDCNLQLKPRRCGRKNQNKKAGDKRSFQSTAEWAKEHYETNFFLPVVFHNLKSYDAHFVIKYFKRKYTQISGTASYDDISIIPLNSQKYLQFQIGELRFLDSFQFLSTSPDELVSLLRKSGKEKFVHTKQHMGTDEDIVFSKGVYPYSYMTGPEKFEETQLPPIDCFYDKVRDETMKEEDYQRAKDTWSRFGIKTMKDYHDHYLLSDVLLLADVFENFRQVVYESHKLDCLHFVTLPSLAWAMALKHTGVELGLITDPEVYLMIENNLRGGIATISQRYASANNPQLNDFDPNEANNYITYLDANSLYATAQSEPLPVGNFQFLSDEEISRFDLHSVAPDASTGYIIECDLEYPSHLHDLHNDYPMAPDHLTVTRDMLSPFAMSLLDDSPHTWIPTQKLVPNLLNKTKYVTHYRNLKLYVKHGLKVTKIHRIISFDQSPWLKSWIDHCNKQRREATSDFHSDLAKLQANATFGKNNGTGSAPRQHSLDCRPQQTVKSCQQSLVPAERDN